MQIVYGKTLTKEDVLKINGISSECGIMFDTARLLFYRNVDTVDKVKRFLNPSIKNLHNPYLFNDMQKVVSRIKDAKYFNQKVLIFGDYDADGVCASSVLYYSLIEYGIIPTVMVPEREEGYGLNLEKILALNEKEGVDLLITVDCGISEYENIEILKQHGIDVIVSDHHEAPEILPKCLIINPKKPNENYPFSGLCGAGVAYKISFALIGEKANKYLDFVAVATVADSMELVDENRDIIHDGLKLFKPSKIRPCMKYLIGDSDKEVNSNTLAYQIAPRVNAGGRMGDANSALSLFTSQNEQEIFDIAVKLNTYNVQRQEESQRVYETAKSDIINQNLLTNPIICVKGEGWNAGVIGIVAAKLVEDFNRPVIVFAEQEDKLKGSARSVEEVNVFELIFKCQEHLLGFGGHSQAAGVSVSKQNYEDFYQALIKVMQDEYKDIKFTKTVYCDWQINSPISIDFAREISLLEPFGVGNKKPLFTTNCNKVVSKPLREKSPHYTFDTKALQMLDFNGEKNVEALSLNTFKTIVFEANYSVFRGQESVKGFVKKIISDYTLRKDVDLEIFRNEIVKLKYSQQMPNQIGFDKDLIKKGYGTIYTASNFEVLKNYNNADNLTISLFEPESSCGENCIVISLRKLPEGYNKICYLDTPLAYIPDRAEQTVVKGLSNQMQCSTDRQVFAKIYSILLDNLNKPFFNSVDFYKTNNFSVDANTFIFAVEVFFELGFFKVENGILKRNSTQKNELTNSTIYSRMLIIKGRQVKDV